MDGCEHIWLTEITKRPNASGGQRSQKLQIKGQDNFQELVDYSKRETQSEFCQLCNAWKGSLGHEPTFQLYIQHLMRIFDEVKRVLRPDGTCWVNLGDTHGGTKTGNTETNKNPNVVTNSFTKSGGTPKSLCQIPSRFAIAMTDAGWLLRNEIIWKKVNCMPSSASDRFTVDFEKVYFFTKQGKYWFEQQFEPYTEPMDRWGGDNLKADGKSLWDEGTGQTSYRNRNMRPNEKGRNMRCIWDIPTKGNPENHFAVFPPKLVEPMIKAGCPERGIVADIFSGSGTTCAEAKRLNRQYIGFDLNAEYVTEIAEKKLARTFYQHEMFKETP